MTLRCLGNFYKIAWVPEPEWVKSSLLLPDSPESKKIRLATISEKPLNQSMDLDLRIGDAVYVFQPAVLEIEDELFVSSHNIIAEFIDK